MSDQTNQDEQDGLRLSLSFRSSKQPTQIPVAQKPIAEESIGLPVIPSMDDDYYKMTHKNRGIALIFNHYKFDQPELSSREGTDKDCNDVNKVLTGLGFKTLVHRDLKSGRIEEELHTVSKMDHSENDCLVVVVMTHGDPDILNARDESYPTSVLWEPFTGDRCKSLAGKPKLFFIQACRGTNIDEGVVCQVEFDSTPRNKPVTIKIPKMADFLVMYSTPLGNYSFRSPSNGSWFIQSLCRELKERATNDDLYKILICVNRTMAFCYKSNVPSSRELNDKKQVGQIVSSLTRLIRFNRNVPSE